MEGDIFEPEKDSGKIHFQQELNKWFESRGIITDLRSHLRHLMITALQGTRIDMRPTDGSSPKAQALNLMVAEYLFKHNCHYTLSVFTSEVPTLANFNPELALKEEKRDAAKKPSGGCFRGNEIEEIFNALGMSSHEEELSFLKAKYLDKGNEASLFELFLQTVVEMSAKLHIRENLESLAVEDDKRLLSKKWSAKITDILLAEKMASPQITAIEGAIFRITEREIKRIIGEKRRMELETLTNRERRIQEFLRKHEDNIILRLMEAEKDLMTRKGIIDEELTERQKHLMRIALEWNNKHEEIVRLSKSFHKIEMENRSLQKKLLLLEEENNILRSQGECQNNTIETLRGETNSLMTKLKEVTDSNAVLSVQIQSLMSKKNKEVSVSHEKVNKKEENAIGEEIPLLWSKNLGFDDAICSERESKEEFESRAKVKDFPVKIPTTNNSAEGMKSLCSEPETKMAEINSNLLIEEDQSSISYSSDEVITEVRKKLLDLEEESNRINKNYLEYKLKCVSTDSSSESSSNISNKSIRSNKSELNVSEKVVPIRETKFCQTVSEETLRKIEQLKEMKEKSDYDYVLAKKLQEVSPRMPAMRIPTTRQLQNRDFFNKSRQLLHEMEKQNLEELPGTSPSVAESPTYSSGEECIRSTNRRSRKSPKNSVLLTPLRTTSFYCNDEIELEKQSVDNNKNRSPNSLKSVHKQDIEMDAEKRLALLEETRIKSPQISARKPLRQQILLSESDKDDKILISNKSIISSPESPYSSKICGSRKSENDTFW